MRITVAHNRGKEQVKQSIDRCFDDLFRGISIVPIQFVDERRIWQGSTLTFSLGARMGPLTNPMKGTIDVTDKDVTIDIDLGLLERVLPGNQVRTRLTERVRGLLT